MFFIETAFNKTNRRRPIASIIHNDTNNQTELVLFDQPNRSRAEKESKIISTLIPIIAHETVLLDNFKNYLEMIAELQKYDPQLNSIRPNGVYDTLQCDDVIYDQTTIKTTLAKRLIRLKSIEPQNWQKLAAKAVVVYYELQKRGIFCEGALVNPIYSIDTFSGRSKSAEFNIQGMTSDYHITSTTNGYDTFICADWIAADMRVASLLSDDETLQNSYKVSDPYMYLAEKVGGTRDECKRGLFKGVYSLDYDSPALELYPKLKQWVIKSREALANDRYLTSILGRKFHLSGDRDEKSVVNASIQGSVAHAMQNVMIKLYEVMPYYLMTELHDSVILCCNSKSAIEVIKKLRDIMLYPFNGLLNSNPKFPVRISVGNTWRNWKTIKEYR